MDAQVTLTNDLQPLVAPRSVAIVGLSTKPGSAGLVVLQNLLTAGFDGDLHLVGRSGGEVEGRTVKTSVAELPEGVDLAILLLPSDVVLDTVKACVARGVRAAVCFASGFAEMGDEGRAKQQEIADTARAGDDARFFASHEHFWIGRLQIPIHRIGMEVGYAAYSWDASRF